MKFLLTFACNNPNNGMDTGKVDAISFGSADTLELYGKTLRLRQVDDHHIRIGHITLPHKGYRTWVGNWCWDGAWVETEDAARLLRYLRLHGWECESGEVGLVEKFEAGQEISAEDIEKALPEHLQAAVDAGKAE